MSPEAAEPATLVLQDGVILLGAALLFVMAFRRLGGDRPASGLVLDGPGPAEPAR